MVRDRLKALGLNLWWTWHPEVIELFRELDPEIWRGTNHNPIALLARLSDELLAERIERESLESRINFHSRRLHEYLVDDQTWCAAHAGVLRAAPVAYFSAEFGLHESLPLYSGGLGVLAGDHLKSASDLGIPAVGVGLFYARGYFRQRVEPSGWQQEEYGPSDIATFPLVHAAAPDGSTLSVRVECGAESLHALVWIAHVGRARLVLLDSNAEANPPHVRELTATLYGGDQLTRIRQEILLGIGGLKALRALGIRPSILHLNEGHSAFAILERVRERVEDGVTFEDALRDTAIHTVFTTHTPVEAGHDRFGADLVEQQLGRLRTRLGLDQRRFMALGRTDDSNMQEPFCMTVLGLKGSRRRNGVSSLHGHVTRRMWQTVWRGRSEEDVPIGHITNGVHTASWLAPSMKHLYDRHLGSDWLLRQADRHVWQSLANVDEGELWETHTVLRRTLVNFVRRRTNLAPILDPSALTIGFARRFASYKRATLLLTDLDRLARLCSDRNAPLQFVFAGKAHPRDDDGKRLIQQIVELSRDARFAGRLAFVEDYDMNVARHLVQGVDVWLNTPLRPLEASGTSGQKVALNGGLNLSTLDGWWAEAYDGQNGFAIGAGSVHADPAIQWSRDAASLYEILETEVVPLFFDLDAAGLPSRWIRFMKHSIMTLAWRYNADRMVMNYVDACYLPAAGGLTHG
ncbi:MAG: alpha-glucan phosphorylase [Acidobacteria bacterium RIFCSPLOWO2_02_FULL_65_29]|nr:MAG: alpha-glucan phosphorylase [Acidobacteria bacterium RIFCSPLOWO2_02_FULL_65_29]